MNIWITSDLHFCHNRDFIYGPRGFSSVKEHDETLIENFNKVVKPDDQLYILGDWFLNDNWNGMSCLERLNGTKALIVGNHDTDERIIMVKEKAQSSAYFEFLGYGCRIKADGLHFLLSHYPTLCGNFDWDKPLKAQAINLSGHTHSKQKFEFLPNLIYNVSVDAHNNYPVNIEDICKEVREMKNGKRE